MGLNIISRIEHMIRFSEILAPGPLRFIDEASVLIVLRHHISSNFRNSTFGSVNSRTRLIKPKYEITATRKFEFTELMEVFFGKPGRIITAALIIVSFECY